MRLIGLYGGATEIPYVRMVGKMVSIHAPTGGATSQSSGSKPLLKQSRLLTTKHKGRIDGLQKMAIADCILFSAYKFSGNKMIQGAVLSIAAVVSAKQIPYVKDYV